MKTYFVASAGLPYQAVYGTEKLPIHGMTPTERFTEYFRDVLGARDIQPSKEVGGFVETEFHSGKHGASIIKHLP